LIAIIGRGLHPCKETLETPVIAGQLLIQSSISMKFELMLLMTHEKIFQGHEKSEISMKSKVIKFMIDKKYFHGEKK